MRYRIIKRLPFLIVLFLLLSVGKATLAQQKNILKSKITVSLPPDSLIETLLRLQQKTGNNFAFDPDQLRKAKTPGVKFTETILSVILEKILSGTNLDFKQIGNDIVITPKKITEQTIHGHVRDNANGEQLIGASVQIPELKVGVTTNQYGFYSISVPAGNYLLRISKPGYQTVQQSVNLNQNRQEEFELSLQERQLEEVVIKQSNISPNPILGNEKNFIAIQVKNVPYYAGEADVMKRLQMENGVRTITEGSSGLFVRGGNSDQNLILLDEAIIYNPSHLYGLVSVFNPDAVNNLQVYRDYMPANFGGRLSSVIVNSMAEGNNKEFHLSGGVNLMSARIAAEGPIVKEKGSFIVSYRRSLLDVFHSKFKLFNPNSVYHDINAKGNYKINKDNNVFYSLYVGKDHLFSDNSYTNDWGNLTSTFRWNHIFNSKLFLNISAIYSNYSNLLDLNADTLSQKSQWSTGVKDLTLKADYTYYRSPSNQIKFGVSGIYHQFTPGEMYKQDAFEFNISRDRSVESAIYYSQKFSLNKAFEFNYGIRFGVFVNAEKLQNVFDEQGNRLEKYEYKHFANPEPRINLSYLPASNQRIFITYNLNYQYLQLIQNSTLAFSSLESWVPASKTIKPQRSNHVAIGYHYSPQNYLFSAGVYYKKMDNQLDLIGHAQIIANPEIRNQLRAGNSNAYGLEIEVNKNAGKFTGTLAYNYSRVYRKIADINFGERFMTNYDIPHELKLSARYGLNDNFAFQAFFTYATGRPLTLPVGYYQHDGLNVPIFERRNTVRFPDFSRLDISAQYRLKTRLTEKKALIHHISVGVYNLYNQKNPLYYHLNSSSFESTKSTIQYGFGFYPWLAYSFKI